MSFFINQSPILKTCHSEPFACHPESFDCHAERSEASQDRLREGSRGKLREESDMLDPSASPQDDTFVNCVTFQIYSATTKTPHCFLFSKDAPEEVPWLPPD